MTSLLIQRCGYKKNNIEPTNDKQLKCLPGNDKIFTKKKNYFLPD